MSKTMTRESGTGTRNWRWLFTDEAGVVRPGPAPLRFASAEDAERWLTAQAGPIRAAGITGVTLLDGEHVVYGPAALARVQRLAG